MNSAERQSSILSVYHLDYLCNFFVGRCAPFVIHQSYHFQHVVDVVHILFHRCKDSYHGSNQFGVFEDSGVDAL